MAQNNVFIYKLKTDRGTVGGQTFSAGKVVKVIWEDTFPAHIDAYLMDDLEDTSPTLLTNGPSLGIGPTDHQLIDYFYRFCGQTTALPPGPHLHKFKRTPYQFPYAFREVILNATICNTTPSPSCDLAFSGSPVITATTSATAKDGAITVTATSSNGTIKYGLTDFDYTTEGQTSATFSNLFAGAYTVYAKDSYGCAISTEVVIPPTDLYGVRLVCEWDDELLKHGHKVEIEEQGYAGYSSTMIASGSPATYRLNADGDDRFSVIRASEFRLRVQVQTNFQYSFLYTEDDRKYRFKYYRDSGSGYALKWVGYIDPYLYGESYTATPYEIEIIATDCLAALKNIDFVDQSGNDFVRRNTALTFICQILKKLDQNINLRTALNLYEDNHNSAASDDPLAQTYVNPLLYYDLTEITDGHLKAENCAHVIENILKEFGAVICQADAKWLIYRPEETKAPFDFREYDLTAAYITNGTIDPLVYLKDSSQSNRICWRDRSGFMTMLPSYGKFIVRQLLNVKKSLLPSYGFELWNKVPYEGDTEFFAGWNIALTYGAGVTWGHEVVERDKSNGAMYIQFEQDVNENPNPGYKEVIVYTLYNSITYKNGDLIKFSFDYRLDAFKDAFPWILIEYQVKINNLYLQQDKSWSTTEEFVEVYPEKFNEFQKYEILVNSPGGVDETDGDLSVVLRLNNGGFTDTDESSYGLDYLENVVTANLSGLRRVIYSSDNPEGRHYYKLDNNFNEDPTDYPEVIRVGDWSTGNKKAWRLQETYDYVRSLWALHSITIDNLIVRYLPDKAEPAPVQENIITINPNNKRTLEVEILQGDLTVTATNAKNAYDSYFENISGFLTDSWTRDGISEADYIQRIFLRSLISQFQKNARRLQGSFVSDVYMLPYSCVVETMDDDRLYQTQGLEIEFKQITHTLDLYELKDIDASPDDGGGNPNPFSGAFDPQAFNINFD